MPELEDLRALVETLERGSFSAAAVRLGVSKQIVSRRVAALEADLGARLLQRTTRRLSPTEAGLAYAERARRVLLELAEAEQEVAHGDGTPRGRLRVSAPVSFGTLHLAPALPGFLARHPGVEAEIDLDDREVDLVGEGYDVAVRLGRLADSSLIALRIARIRLLTCASPAYLERHGAPQAPADLRRHACLLYSVARGADWRFGAARVVVSGRLRTNNGEVLLAAAIAGAGIARIPEFLAGPALLDGRLREVLPAHACEEGGAYVVYPRHRQGSAAIRAFAAYLQEYFASVRQPEPGPVIASGRTQSSNSAAVT